MLRWSSAEVQGFEDGGLAAKLGRVLEPLRVHDGLQVEYRRLEESVDYNEVEMSGLRDLEPRIHHALGNHLGLVFAAPLQPLRQFVPAGRKDEDQHRVGE